MVGARELLAAAAGVGHLAAGSGPSTLTAGQAAADRGTPSPAWWDRKRRPEGVTSYCDAADRALLARVLTATALGPAAAAAAGRVGAAAAVVGAVAGVRFGYRGASLGPGCPGSAAVACTWWRAGGAEILQHPHVTFLFSWLVSPHLGCWIGKGNCS